MRLLFVCFLFIGCISAPTPEPQAKSPADTAIKKRDPAKDYMDSIISALNYMGIRERLDTERQKNEVLYYKTGEDKYRIRHNRLVDSVNKYRNIINSQLNQK